MSMTNFTLLYVEDDIETQEKMKMILESNVKELYQAYDGQEGLSIYKEKNPDIILTDINMPILDGLSMTKKIKELDSTKPIMVLSAFDDKEFLLKAINIGVDYFIPKPIDIDILDTRLDFFAENLQNKIDIEIAKKREKEYLYNLAHVDSLTKIPNRLYFNSQLEQALSKAKRNNSSVTLFFIDLDNFKNINDTYGHAAGDKVLTSITQNIKNVIRVEDTFSRISGDEFSLIIENITDKTYLDTFAKKILKAASTPIDFHGNILSITCSIGISSYPKDTLSQDELIHLADTAMYEAKKNGKSNYVYFDSL